MKKVVFIFFTIVLAGLLTFNGCTQQVSTPTQNLTLPAAQTTTPITSTQPDSQPKYGGILKIISVGSGPVNIGSPGSRNSQQDPSTGRPAVEWLMGIDPGANLVPWLATSWEYSSDYKSLTIHLREGVKFHDGTDFNAEAAKFCLDLVRESPEQSGLKNVTSIDVVDDYTIRLTTEAYDATLLFTVQANSKMVSPTAIKTMGDECKLHPVGTGPFKFVSYQRDQLLKYERNDDYWNGKPYLDGIEYTFIADSMTALASFKAGQGHLIANLPAADLASLKTAGFIPVTAWGATMGFIGDSGNPDSPFSDIKVRQAVSYAVNAGEIAQVIGHGFYPAVNQIAPPDAWYHSSDVIGYPYNPDKAKQLLAEAGYPNGFKTTLSFRTSTRDLDVFTAVQAYLAEIGITAELDAADSARFLQISMEGWKNGLISFDAPCSTGFDPGSSLRSNLSSLRNKNKSAYIPPDYDEKLLKESASEPDFTKRAAMFHEIQKMIIDEYCLVTPLYIYPNTSAKAPWAHDLNLFENSYHDWNPERAWIEK